MFSEVLINGCKEEIEGTDPEDLSPYFKGTRKDIVHSIVTLASPINGTTAYDLSFDENFDAEAVKVPLWSNFFAKLTARATTAQKDGRDAKDYAAYDMHLDNAMELNKHLTTFDHVYYFSVPCSCTEEQADGTQKPTKDMDPFFVKKAYQMGCYTGVTKVGYVVDRSWQENDGLVNTISAKAPFGEPQKELDRSCIEPGVWNIFPVYKGDHMAVHGGLTKTRNVLMNYLELVSMIQGLR